MIQKLSNKEPVQEGAGHKFPLSRPDLTKIESFPGTFTWMWDIVLTTTNLDVQYLSQSLQIGTSFSPAPSNTTTGTGTGTTTMYTRTTTRGH